MKTLLAILLTLSLAVLCASAAAPKDPSVPKYNLATEGVYKGTVLEIRDRQCPVSGGMGAHVIMKLADNNTIEVHIAPTRFVKSYEVVFSKGDQIEVTGSMVKFEGVDTIFAREIKRGNDTFMFRDKDGNPVW